MIHKSLFYLREICGFSAGQLLCDDPLEVVPKQILQIFLQETSDIKCALLKIKNILFAFRKALDTVHT